MAVTIAELNQLDQPEFVSRLGGIFEHTPVIAERAWLHRPFQDVADLHHKMVSEMQSLEPAAQTALICAHPELGAKVKMAEASVKEQSGVGLDRLTPEEYARFWSLNQSYKAKFDFPFIIAVKNHTKTSILAAFEQRLNNSREAEFQQALTEIAQIARFRLQDWVTD